METERKQMAAAVYYDKDARLEDLKGARIVIYGYGSQGHAHAQNLHDSGLEVAVALRPGSPRLARAQAAGLKVYDNLSRAAKDADLVALLINDEHQKALYEEHIAPNLRDRATLLFAHGFNIRFGQVVPKPSYDVILIAPKSPGHLLRRQFVEGRGVPALLAVAQDATGRAKPIALAYARALGSTRAGVIETTFQEETETDLFGEQAVLCGGVSALIQAGFDILCEAGYQPEVAYFECLHELKLIVDLIYEGGIANMRYSVSDTAEYGDLTRGPVVVGEVARAAMRKLLADIQSGQFAREFIEENRKGRPNMNRLRAQGKEHPIEQVGARLRAMMPWLGGPAKE
ncbi:MAG TPA: ketol-acid reductoisomerase [Polyangia bacterium]|nr:ketol-acid reductoisomerase [Polyangia bacterium]